MGTGWATIEEFTGLADFAAFPRLMPVTTRAQTLGNTFLDPGRGLTAPRNEDLKVIFAEY
jgi:hypothetical protein